MKNGGYGLITTMTVITVIILATTDIIQDLVPALAWIGLILVITGLIPIIAPFVSSSGVSKISPFIVVLLGLSLIFFGWVITFISS